MERKRVLNDVLFLKKRRIREAAAAACDLFDGSARERGENGRLEGKATDWLLLDFGDVIVHIFLPDAREHYNLEKLWADAEEISTDKFAN